MARKYFKIREDVVYLTDYTVTEFELKNEKIGDKQKTVFYAENNFETTKQKFVYWGLCALDANDVINVKGRIQGDIFVVWDYRITKKAARSAS